MIKKVIPSYKWRSIKGDVYPADMETSHLFFVVRMLWNNCAPEHLKLHPYKRWNIGYSRHYQKESVGHMLAELKNRPDVEDKFLKQLRFMANHAEKEFSFIA